MLAKKSGALLAVQVAKHGLMICLRKDFQSGQNAEVGGYPISLERTFLVLLKCINIMSHSEAIL